MVLVDFYSTGNLTCFLNHIELMFPIFTLLIFVPSGDSSGISVTGETPQERGFRDEEAHRTPHGKRPLGTEISGSRIYLFHQRHILYNPKNTAYRINTCRRCFCFIDQSTTKYLASGCANTIAETDASGSIMNPSVNSTPISSGFIKPNSFAWSSRFGHAG